MRFTESDIPAFAPDPGTARRAKGIATARKWRCLAGNERIVWGEFIAGDAGYQVAVDLTGPTFRCNCPVPRKPCKHGLALLLLLATHPQIFHKNEQPPAWVEQWLQKLDERPVKNLTPLQRTPVHERTRAELHRKNREKRLSQMTAGLQELETWLDDLLRQGMATLEGLADAYWQEIASRMVDAKLGNLARRIRQLPLLMQTGAGSPWHEKMLEELGDIYLLVKGFLRLEQLPEPLQDDLLQLAGIHFKKDDLLQLPGLDDCWLVAGQTEEWADDNLLARRTWLLGQQSRRTALLLEYAWGNNPYEHTWRLGSVLRGEVVFYPSAYPLRVLFKKFEWTTSSFTLQNGYSTLSAFAKAWAEAIAANPWLSPFPAFLEMVVPVYREGGFFLVDREHKQLPVSAGDAPGWEMVAIAGGQPVHIFGQWDGKAFMPLSAVVDRKFRLLHQAEPLPRRAWQWKESDLPF